MTLDLGKIREAAADGMLVREMARMEEERVSWREALVQTDSIAKQMKELTQVGSVYAQMVKDIKALQSPASRLAQEYGDLFRVGSSALETVRLWQESQRVEQDSVRRMLEPLADIRKSLMLDDSTQRLIKEISAGASLSNSHQSSKGSSSGLQPIA